MATQATPPHTIPVVVRCTEEPSPNHGEMVQCVMHLSDGDSEVLTTYRPEEENFLDTEALIGHPASSAHDIARQQFAEWMATGFTYEA